MTRMRLAQIKLWPKKNKITRFSTKMPINIRVGRSSFFYYDYYYYYYYYLSTFYVLISGQNQNVYEKVNV